MDNKKIIFQVTKTYMMKNRKRTLITFLGILIMVILMTAVFIGRDTLLDYLKNAVETDSGSWHYQVYDIDKEQAEQIKALSFVERFDVSKPLGYTAFPASGNPETTPFLELKAYSGSLFEQMNIQVKEGRYPENADEVIISQRALDEGAEIQPGDTIDIDCFERYIHAFTYEETEARKKEGFEQNKALFPFEFHITPGETLKTPDHFPYNQTNAAIEMIHKPTGLKKRLTVVGIMEEPFFGLPSQGGYIALTGADQTETGNEKLNAVLTIDIHTKEDCFGEIAKILDNSRTPEERETALKQGSSYQTKTGAMIPVENGRIVANDPLLAFTANGQDHKLNFLMLFCQAFFVVLITAASLVLIYNVFTMSYRERCRYLGMLSSVGATRKQKKWSVYYEVFSLLCLSLPLGIIIGLLGVKGGMALLYPHFSKIFDTIIFNVVSKRSYEISYHLVINPLNILLIILFSVIAVWISAWSPARKISKIGPVESIRGNETSMKLRKKGYKSYLGMMRKGEAEKLLGTASVERNDASTKGIIRSITAFTALTLITAFAAGSIGDILVTMQDAEEILPGTAYNGYSYVFQNDAFLADERYQSGKDDITNSTYVSGYQELNITYFTECIPLEFYSEAYQNKAKEILEQWFPDASPETIQQYLTGEGKYKNIYSCPWGGFITLKNEAFNRLADHAGISLAQYKDAETCPVLVYDTLRITSNDFKFFAEDAHKPDYAKYEFKQPLSVKEGDSIRMELLEYDEETDEAYKCTIPAAFAGYVNAEAVQEYCVLNSNRVFMFISEQTQEQIRLTDPAFGTNDTSKFIFFNTDDAELIRTLSGIKDEFGRSALRSTEIFNMTDFAGVITKIANIVAVCFTLLIALICLLNLYNSVMGRCLARHTEMAVLHSLGITQKQKNKMLLTENIRILTKAFRNAAVITLVFVLCLYKLLAVEYAGLHITFPVWVIVITLLTGIAGLTIFTKACYGHDSGKRLIEEIRMESI